MDQNTINEGKTLAAISYITLIGLLIAFIMNNDKKNKFIKFHIGQSLRVWILGIALHFLAMIFVMITGMGFLGYLGWVAWILAVLGIINALNGKAEPLPFIGTIGG